MSTAPGFVYATGLADTALALDAPSASAVFVANFNDTATGDVQTEGRLVFSNSLVESTSLSQDEVSSLLVYGTAVQEAAIIERVIPNGLGFSTGGFASGPFSGLGDSVANVSGDVFLANITVLKTFSATAQILDRPFGSIAFSTNTADAVEIQDEVSAVPEYLGIFASTAQAADEVSSIPTYGVRVNETATAVDQTSSLTELICTVFDTASGAELLFTSVEFSASVSDVALGQESIATQIVVNASVAHVVHAIDQMTGRRQWENIDTFDTVNWVTVATADSVDWELIKTNL
jgi:hypothetical protein